MAKDVVQMLNERVVLGDGGYVEEAKFRGYRTPRVIVEFPNVPRLIHQEFVRAGSQVLRAQTGWTTQSHLERRGQPGLGARSEEITRKAVELAREAAGDEALVAGTLWPTGLFDTDPDRARVEWEEQIAVMAEMGVELLICESFRRLDEARLALACCKQVSIPTMVTVSIDWRAETTQDGASPAACARALADEGADIVGANGAREPEDLLPVALEMREAVDLPVAFQPSGFRIRASGWERSPEAMMIPGIEMANYALRAKIHGIHYIGGDQGVGPERICAIAQSLGCARFHYRLI